MDFSFDLGNETVANDVTVIPSPLLTTKQAAIYLGLSMSTFNKWRCYGSGPAFLKLGRAVRYRKAQLDNFLAERVASNTIYNTISFINWSPLRKMRRPSLLYFACPYSTYSENPPITPILKPSTAGFAKSA